MFYYSNSKWGGKILQEKTKKMQQKLCFYAAAASTLPFPYSSNFSAETLLLVKFRWLHDNFFSFSSILRKNIYINVYLKQVSDRLIFKQPLEDIISLQFNLVLILMPSFFANIQLNCHAWQTPNRYILNEAEKI